MERLTLACLQHLPTAVLVAADLTGQCGTSVADQWRIRWGLVESGWVEGLLVLLSPSAGGSAAVACWSAALF